MLKKYRRYIGIGCLGAVLFASCTSHDEEAPLQPAEEPTAVGFTANVQGSRAVADLNAVQSNGFSVWGGYGTTDVFTGDKVMYNGSEWTYGTPKYWTYNTYNFYAVYPDATSGVYNKVETNNTTNQLTIKEFDSSKGYDLMRASVLNVEGSNPPENVSLNFKHTLTHLSVSLKKDSRNQNDEIKVTGVYFIGMNIKGDYADATTEAWSNWSNVSYMGQDFTSAPVTLAADGLTSCVTGILVIPQTITENMSLLINYTYSPNGSTASSTQTITSNIPVTTPWEIGKKITYTGTIHVDDKIEFSTPVVETWGSEQAGGTIIIK